MSQKVEINDPEIIDLEMDSQFCPRCGEAWFSHNDDGSCVEDGFTTNFI